MIMREICGLKMDMCLIRGLGIGIFLENDLIDQVITKLWSKHLLGFQNLLAEEFLAEGNCLTNLLNSIKQVLVFMFYFSRICQSNERVSTDIETSLQNDLKIFLLNGPKSQFIEIQPLIFFLGPRGQKCIAQKNFVKKIFSKAPPLQKTFVVDIFFAWFELNGQIQAFFSKFDQLRKISYRNTALRITLEQIKQKKITRNTVLRSMGRSLQIILDNQLKRSKNETPLKIGAIKGKFIFMTIKQFSDQYLDDIISKMMPSLISYLYQLKNSYTMNTKFSISKLVLICAVCINYACSKMAFLIDIGNPGARYPVYDIYDGTNVSSDLKGQLNGVGMRQQYLLGTYIRADYIDKEEILPKTYNPKMMEVFVSSVDRSIDTALARMYGFYPPGQGWKIPSEVDPSELNPPFETNVTSYLRFVDEQFALQNGFTPVPVTNLENVLNAPCPNEGLLKTKRYSEISKTVATFQAQFTTFLAKIKLVFNISSLQLTIQHMGDLYDTIVCDITLGKDIPQEFDASDFRILKYISDYYNTLLYSSTYGSTHATQILTEAKLRFDTAINDPISPKKYAAYFPTEPDMLAAAGILNLTSPECLTQKFKNQTMTYLNCVDPPSFSSNLLIELHEDDSFQFQIRVKYNGEYVYLCEKKQYFCSYNQFWGRVAASVSRDSFQHNCNDKLDL